jgi:hypothetical protein
MKEFWRENETLTNDYRGSQRIYQAVINELVLMKSEPQKLLVRRIGIFDNGKGTLLP